MMKAGYLHTACRRRIASLLLFLFLLLLSLPCFPSEAAAEEDMPGMRIHAFSLGKADAFLITEKSGAVLIDCGLNGQGKDILQFLDENGIEKLDVLIITHFDKDHVGGAPKVLKKIPVGKVLQSNCPKDSGEYERYLKALGQTGIESVTVREKTDFSVGGMTFTVYPPEKERYLTEESNNSSLVTSVRYGETGILFTGDCEGERLLELLQTDPGRNDVLQIPHHGKWQVQLPALLEKTQPSFALITSSLEEPEDYMTLYTLGNAGIPVLLTRDGALDIFSDGRSARSELVRK